MGAHTEALCLTADSSSSSSDDDETYKASPATTSELSESPATAICIKRKIQKSDQQSPIVACLYNSDGTAVLCCMNQ